MVSVTGGPGFAVAAWARASPKPLGTTNTARTVPSRIAATPAVSDSSVSSTLSAAAKVAQQYVGTRPADGNDVLLKRQARHQATPQSPEICADRA